MRAGRLGGAVALAVAHLAAGGCARPLLPGDVPADGGGPASAAAGGSAASGGDAAVDAGAPGAPGDAVGPADPAGWAEVAAPAGSAGLVVSDAWAVGPGEIIFIGAIGAGPQYTPRAFRFANGLWRSELDLPAAESSRPSIHGTAADDIWVVAGDQIHHRDASGWARVADDGWQASVPRSRFDPEAPVGMTRVRAAGPDDIWVVGGVPDAYSGAFILHRTRGTSTLFVLDDPEAEHPISYRYTDIYIARPDDVWLSGGSDVVGTTMDPAFLFHWDGAEWTTRGWGRWTQAGLWPTGDGGLWILQPSIWDDKGVVPMSRFDGDDFRTVPIEGQPSSMKLYSIWGAAPDDVWAAGDDLAHWDGQTWRVVGEAPAVLAAASTYPPNTIVTGDPTATWLVTTGPRFFRKLRAP